MYISIIDFKTLKIAKLDFVKQKNGFFSIFLINISIIESIKPLRQHPGIERKRASSEVEMTHPGKRASFPESTADWHVVSNVTTQCRKEKAITTLRLCDFAVGINQGKTGPTKDAGKWVCNRGLRTVVLP
jgi:hypothetical protein